MSDARATVAHQFDDAAQQRDTATFGMWVFLVTEILFFGALFAVYTVYRASYPAAFADASGHLNLKLGAVNTVVLIASSLTMALAVREAQLGGRRGLIAFLLLTILLGSVFLGIKAVEYSHKFHERLVPTNAFRYDGPHARAARLYFSLYFAITGMHATHMVIGVVLLALLVRQAARGRFSADYYSPVETTGLYWHFVDIAWIFIFPLIYLIGGH